MWDRNGDKSTISGRLTTRRIELNMRQEEVAAEIDAARAAYSQYETGKVTPNLDKLTRLAAVLKVTPEWLTFGIGERVVSEELTYSAPARTWVRERSWSLNDMWMAEHLKASSPADVVLTTLTMESPSGTYQVGDVALVDKAARPSDQNTDEEFIFALHGQSMIGRIRKVDSDFHITFADARTETVSPQAVRMLGKVVGAIILAD